MSTLLARYHLVPFLLTINSGSKHGALAINQSSLPYGAYGVGLVIPFPVIGTTNVHPSLCVDASVVVSESFTELSDLFPQPTAIDATIATASNIEINFLFTCFPP